jgi:tetratricopeptide (TPR) repeat protein
MVYTVFLSRLNHIRIPMKSRFVKCTLALVFAACGGEVPEQPQEQSNAGTAAFVASAGQGEGAAARFVDVAEQVGIDFVHTSGRSGRKYGVETIGSGVVFFDYDSDGWIDLYAVNGADLPGYTSAEKPLNALYRNDGGFFSEVAQAQGVADAEYGMGASAGDYDNDGDADLFVSNFGPNALYRNGGESVGWGFTHVKEAMVGQDTSWSTGSAFVDYDLDGDLDLYVANYLDYSFEEVRLDTSGSLKRPRRHLAPTEYPGRRDFLYRNDGGHFVDATEEAGLLSLQCRELGPVFFDADLDGDADLFQGNDATPNFLYRNDGGHFVEVGLFAGVAYNEAGKPEGTMGVDVADYDLDGLPDIVMTNFQWESNTLYHNLGNGLFRDVSVDAQIGASSFARLAFGINFLDYDLDGDEDFYVVNGHIDEDIERFDPQASYAQRDQLYRNDGTGRFGEVSDRAGPGLEIERVGRGSAVADYDNDGDPDIFVLNTAETAVLLRNDSAHAENWLELTLRGTQNNRDGYGVRVEMWSEGRRQVKEKRSSASYLSQNDPRLHFGLGVAQQADSLVVYWPRGSRQVLRETAARQVLVIEENGAVQREVATGGTAVATGEEVVQDEAMQRFWQRASLVLPAKVRAPVDPVPPLAPLRAAIEQDSQNVSAHIDLAEALLLGRDYGEAEERLAQVLQWAPPKNTRAHARAHALLGRVYSDLGDLERAVMALHQASQLDSTLAAPNYFLGNILVRQQHLEEAVLRYERALALEPRYLQAYFNLAGLHSRQTDYGLALDVLSRGLQYLPGQVELLFQLGRVHFVQARYEQALAVLDKVLRIEPGRAEAHEMIAQIHLNDRDTARAQEALRAGLGHSAENAVLEARLGALLLQEGKAEAAAAHLQRALRADPDNAEVYYNLGQALLRGGKESEGRQLLHYFRLLQEEHQNLLDFKTAIVLNPNDADAFYRLGVIYARIGRYYAASQAYTAALEIAPDHLDALNNLGNIHLRQRRLLQAIDAYNKVLALAPDYARAHHNLGNAYVLLGDATHAIEAFEAAVNRDPAYAQPRQMLSQLYRRSGRVVAADAQQAEYERLRTEAASQ